MNTRQETYIIWNWKDIGRLTFNMCISKVPYTQHWGVFFRLHISVNCDSGLGQRNNLKVTA